MFKKILFTLLPFLMGGLGMDMGMGMGGGWFPSGVLILSVANDYFYLDVGGGYLLLS